MSIPWKSQTSSCSYENSLYLTDSLKESWGPSETTLKTAYSRLLDKGRILLLFPHNKLPQASWIKTTYIYYCIVSAGQKFRETSLGPFSLVRLKSHCQQDWTLWEKNLLPRSFRSHFLAGCPLRKAGGRWAVFTPRGFSHSFSCFSMAPSTTGESSTFQALNLSASSAASDFS